MQKKISETKGGITSSLIAPQHVPPALDDDDDDDDDDEEEEEDEEDNDDDDKLIIIMKRLKVLPWKGSRSWCQQKILCRTAAMLSEAVFLVCLDK